MFRNQKFIITAVTVLILLSYVNIINNDFSIVDDYNGIVQNPQLRNFFLNLKSLNIQAIIFSLFLNLFKLNPLPYHLFSIALHLLNAIFFYFILKNLFKPQIAGIASLIFSIHPINTEAVSWISGNIYLFLGLFFNLIVWFYLKYKKTKSLGFFWLGFFIYCLSLILLRSPWILIIPIAIVIIDQFFLEKSFNLKSLKLLLIFLIPMISFYLIYVRDQQIERLEPRLSSGYLNQQSLKPVLESYPYTIFTMAKQYILPIKLSVYYDGNIISQPEYFSMFIVFLFYLTAIFYFYKKNRKIAGLLILLAALLLPSFSPRKITWYLAERYLYIGTAFFAILLAMILLWLGRVLKKPILTYIILFVILIGFAMKTVLRNNDWQSPESLSQATIKTSPLSVRPYNDLGNFYYLQGDYQQAEDMYYQALRVYPNSNTSISNLGLLYLEQGPPGLIFQTSDKKDPNLSQKYWQMAESSQQQQNLRLSIYYYIHAIKYDSDNPEPLNRLGFIYLDNKKINSAEKIFKTSADLNPDQEKVVYALSYIYYQNKDYIKAKDYLEQTLNINPDHREAQKNLELVLSLIK
jgi:protein O-mannosyl-transferase